MLLLVMSLGLVYFMMIEARDPDNWRWITVFSSGGDSRAADAAVQTPVDNRIAPAAKNELPGTFVSPDEPPPEVQQQPAGRYFPGVKPQLFKTIRDGTIFRDQERESWFNLLKVLKETDQETLDKARPQPATYVQLFRQSDEYRGELVTVSGTVHRACPTGIARNDLGIKKYWQVWLQTRDNRFSPLVVYCLYLPEGFPTGMKVSADVKVTGFFFKRWMYSDANSELRTAPVVVARTVNWAQDAEPGSTKNPIAEKPAPPDPPSVELHDTEPKKPGKKSDTPAAEAAGPRKLLARHDVGSNYFDNLIDGRPLGGKEAVVDETEIMRQILYHVCRFRIWDVERWAGPLPNLAEMVADPESNRGQFYRLSGRATKAGVVRLDKETAMRLEMDRYYRCEVTLDSGRLAVVFAERVPENWKLDKPIDHRASAFGMFLKFAGEENDNPLPVFVAPRLAWHPPTPLGDLDMDVGLLDDLIDRAGLARVRRKALEDSDDLEYRRAAREREAFYAMLAAAGRTEPGELLRQADELLAEAPEKLKRKDADEFSVVPLFTEAAKQRGRLVVLTGYTRRVVKVRVEDPDIVARFGIKHYYELEMFTADSQQNPVAFCVRELPRGMSTSEGSQATENIRVAGFFFKTWAYSVPTPADESESSRRGRRRHPAPLLIGRDLVWYPAEETPVNPLIGIVAGGLFALVLAGIWIGLWRYGRGDKAFHDRAIRTARGMDSGISLDEIGLSTDGTPDFSGLEAMDQGPEAAQSERPSDESGSAR